MTQLATIGSAAMAALLLGAGGAHAADDGSLLSLLDVPSVTVVCFPTGQAGSHNTFNGTQNVNCSQSAQATSSGSGSGSGGFTGYEVVTDSLECPVGATCSITLTCPTGKKVTGGGVYVEPDAPGVHVVRSGVVPGSDNTRWDASVQNDSPVPVDLTVQAMCADVDG
ncbi:hypothetical protein AB0892_21860 [Streptomyces sp. NPDC005409]|uniref:hypothetical protein n=1 Tax=Streptomyces sp. NPDC005409 TaxID=3155342 RepID=UPI00345710F3